MAIPYALRSVRNTLLAIALIGSLTTACKKSGIGGGDVDPRDQYVGTYEGGEKGYQSTITFGTFPTDETGPATIAVTKGANASEIYVDISSKPRMTAKLDEASLTNFSVIDKSSDQINLVINGKQYTFNSSYSATGVFGKDQATGKQTVVINTTAGTVQSGTTVRRTETIVGTRK